MTCPDNRVSIAELRAELRVWKGNYQDEEGYWLRFHDEAGNPIPLQVEVARDALAAQEVERTEKEAALKLVDQGRAENERLLLLLKKAGIDPNTNPGNRR